MSHNRWVHVAFVIATLALPCDARAQESPVGKRVHVVSFGGPRVTGTLVAIDTAHIILRQGSDNTTISLRDVRRIDRVSHEVAYGALAGLALGTTLSLRSGCEGCDRGEDKMIAMFYGALGAGAGAGIGALVKGIREPSRRVYAAPPRTATAIGPVIRKGSVGLRGSIAWR